MAANTAPIYAIQGDVSSNDGTTMAPTLTTAAADYTGASANNQLVFTADATNGGIIRGLFFAPLGTNTASVHVSTLTTVRQTPLLGITHTSEPLASPLRQPQTSQQK